MLLTPTILDLESIPAVFHKYIGGSTVFDSSCSKAAQVWFLDKGEGFFLKTAAKGTLEKEAAMYRFSTKKA